MVADLGVSDLRHFFTNLRWRHSSREVRSKNIPPARQNFLLETLDSRLLLSASPLLLAAAAASLDASDAHSAIIWTNRDKKGFSDEGDRDD
jgi:hypothetical protein